MIPHPSKQVRVRANFQLRRNRLYLLLGTVGVGILVGVGLLRVWDRPIQSLTPPSAPPPLLHLLGKGRTLQNAMQAHGISPDLALRIIQAFRPHVDFRRLKPEDSVEFHHDMTGALTRVIYRQSPVDIVEAWRDGETWSAARRDVPVKRETTLVAGTVAGSLFESMEAIGERGQLVLDFAAIFAWDFDFTSNSQPGDLFRMLVEKVYAGDQFVRYGRIFAAEYESEGKIHTGIYFRERGGGGYYTPGGESLRRAFLKSPLEFTRISSGYTRARRHPILGSLRPHLAIDYAAPAGTPIRAVADGTVEFAGWAGGNGYTVTVRHRADFKTMYNHLSRFGKGIRTRATVRQRQVIGFVGTTGLSTGPHLDYRVIKDGRFVNPLKETFLRGRPISPSARPAFTEARDALLRQLHATLVAQSEAH